MQCLRRGQEPESAPREQAGLKTELDINDEWVMWHTGSSPKRPGLQRYEFMNSDTPVGVHHATDNKCFHREVEGHANHERERAAIVARYAGTEKPSDWQGTDHLRGVIVLT